MTVLELDERLCSLFATQGENINEVNVENSFEICSDIVQRLKACSYKLSNCSNLLESLAKTEYDSFLKSGVLTLLLEINEHKAKRSSSLSSLGMLRFRKLRNRKKTLFSPRRRDYTLANRLTRYRISSFSSDSSYSSLDSREMSGNFRKRNLGWAPTERLNHIKQGLLSDRGLYQVAKSLLMDRRVYLLEKRSIHIPGTFETDGDALTLISNSTLSVEFSFQHAFENSAFSYFIVQEEALLDAMQVRNRLKLYHIHRKLLLNQTDWEARLTSQMIFKTFFKNLDKQQEKRISYPQDEEALMLHLDGLLSSVLTLQQNTTSSRKYLTDLWQGLPQREYGRPVQAWRKLNTSFRLKISLTSEAELLRIVIPSMILRESYYLGKRKAKQWMQMRPAKKTLLAIYFASALHETLEKDSFPIWQAHFQQQVNLDVTAVVSYASLLGKPQLIEKLAQFVSACSGEPLEVGQFLSKHTKLSQLETGFDKIVINVAKRREKSMQNRFFYCCPIGAALVTGSVWTLRFLVNHCRNTIEDGSLETFVSHLSRRHKPCRQFFNQL